MDQKRCYGCMNMRSAQGYVCEHCGYDERTGNLPTQLAPGTVLQNQYLVGKVLGQGGFGITYMGWDISLNTPVAIKEYYPTGFVSRVFPGAAQITVATTAADGWIYNSMEKFIQEARTLAQFSDEGEIVHVRNVFQANGTAYIIMEFVRGITLKNYVMQKGGRITAQEAFSILSPVMSALDRVHKAGVIHRDISPDNIMILPNGKAKLLDFGAARVLGDTASGPAHSTQPVVKHGFAPIEQYQGRGYVGAWTDVYAMCCTIYYCLTGEIPTDAPERVITNQEFSWKAVAPDLTDWQVQVLNWGTHMDATKRIQSMEELRAKLLEEKGGKIPEIKGKEKPGKGGGKKLPLGLILGVAAAAVAVVVGLAIPKKSAEVRSVEDMIRSIGTVDENSMSRLEVIQKAYNALSREDKEQVENYDALQEARSECMELQLVGQWAANPLEYLYNVGDEMYDLVDLVLGEDGKAESEYMSGDWYVENNYLCIDDGSGVYHLELLVEQDGSIVIEPKGFHYIPVEKRNAMLDDMFVIVELTPENIGQYCDFAIITVEEKDSFGELTGDTNTRVILTSPVYEQGLVYFECSDDLAVEVIVPAHRYAYTSSWGGTRYYEEEAESFTVNYGLYSYYGHSIGYKWETSESVPELDASQLTFGRVQGSVVFINSKYVDEILEKDGTRYLVVGGQEYYMGSFHEGFDY